MEKPEKQGKSKVEYIQAYQFKPGQSGNPAGRPRGKSLKEYAAEMLACMTDEERQEYFKGIPKEVIWRMAENNPATQTDITSKGEALPQPILNVYSNNSNEEDKQSQEEN